MHKRRSYLFAAVVLTVALTGGVVAPAAAQGDLFNQLIKIFGIGYAVKALGPQINDFINTLMLNNNVANREKTKIVPILSFGIGFSSPGAAYVGAAQVSGPEEALDTVQAVADIEALFSDVRVKGLVPIDSLTPIPGMFHRVYGVGVTAIIDFRI
jgi:hypothetical protein